MPGFHRGAGIPVSVDRRLANPFDSPGLVTNFYAQNAFGMVCLVFFDMDNLGRLTGDAVVHVVAGGDPGFMGNLRRYWHARDQGRGSEKCRSVAIKGHLGSFAKFASKPYSGLAGNWFDQVVGALCPSSTPQGMTAARSDKRIGIYLARLCRIACHNRLD